MKTSRILAAILVLGSFALAQQTPVPQPSSGASYAGGQAFAPNFGKWSIPLGGAITATGSVAFLASAGYAVTPDGIAFEPFVVGGRINLGLGSTAEVVTITAVSGCVPNIAQGFGTTPTCTVTGTVANTHGISEPISSADNGIMEATSYASATGGGEVYWIVDCGNLTLSTGGLTTTTTCFVPNQMYNEGASARVTTTITTSTSWQLGILGFPLEFTTANATLTAGTTAFTSQGAYAAVIATGATSAGLTPVLITAGTSNAGAGAIHAKVWGYTSAQPNF